MAAIRHQDYLDVASARDILTFRSRLVDFANRLDFDLINAVMVIEQPGKPAAVVGVRNAPEEFDAARTNQPSVRRDPVVSRLKSLSAPFVYDQALYVSDGAGDLWEEQAAHGYKTGVALAMHLPGGRHFLLGVDRDQPLPSDQGQLLRMMADLQLLGAFAQETAVRVLLPHATLTVEVPALSQREQEILRWSRDGKSNEVIGEILSISLSTVNYHLRSAMSKLGVASKFQAAAKADRLGLL